MDGRGVAAVFAADADLEFRLGLAAQRDAHADDGADALGVDRGEGILVEDLLLLVDPQELADVSTYIESLCIPIDHGKYEGADAAVKIAQGKDLYEKQCLECHGKNGEGKKDKFYPVIAGQHYKYLLRQMTEIRDGHRRNANPDMVKVIKPYTNDQLVAISAYQSSLSMPGSMCKPKAGKKK